MSGYLCSRHLLLGKHRRTNLGFLLKNGFFIGKSFASVGLSESNEKLEEKKHSFAVSYFINYCGLSTKSAILASQRVRFRTPEKPDSVLNLLKENGFTNTQISRLVRIAPQLLLSNPEKTLLPKIEFFRSMGASSSDLSRILSSNPTLLRRSLEKHLIPCYDFLKSVLILDEKVVTVFKRSPWVVCMHNMVPNIALLRQVGVLQSTISLLVTNFPSTAFVKHTRFAEAIHEVKEMGYDPSKTVFVNAIQVLLRMSGPKLESKLELYKRWGWSKDVALLAFKRHPNCMLLSDKKITKAMDFLVNKMGGSSTDIARNPQVLFFSLEKRIMPRCSVIQILIAKGLVKNDMSLATFIQPGERCFLDKFVIKFRDGVPELRNVYTEKKDLLDVKIQS
ncbi:transcription termination factor MTERF15, mitochondrial-like [Juglans microcarpa x Juglans regia]|uniref:transcription termination factor MTERF15, mitochondrial-like n=1 Tax=Juglans microcarpa x Juglans regia TaxID=2249226 RepID=UPI001B7E270E|nr:transcription termination factor MTERF15, mitochondrial-like [Juglans microcarpa x Juglans regia]